MRQASFLLLVLFSAGTSLGVDQRLAPLEPDEAAVAKLIDDLGSGNFEVRQAASDGLANLGPEVVPILQKYADHDDPETRARVRGVIHSFGWMERGAIIKEVTPGLRGAKMGLLPGDVIVKIDDFDVNLHTDVNPATENKPSAKWYIWRDGKLVVYDVAAGKIGIVTSNWDINKGGNDQSRGISSVNRKDFDDAYLRLRAAWKSGMEDSESLGALSSLAARAFDAETSFSAYRDFRKLNPDSCMYTHRDTSKNEFSLPFSSAHTHYLLERYKAEPFSPFLYHDLEDWAANHGRNAPLLAELLAKPWPDEDTQRSYRYYHDVARSRHFLDERRYDEAIKLWAHYTNDPKDYYNAPNYPMRAAMLSGQPDATARLLKAELDYYAAKYNSPSSDVWSAVAMVAITGKSESAQSMLSDIEHLPAGYKRTMWALKSAPAMFLPVARDEFRRSYKPKSIGEKPTFRDQLVLAALVADPKSTEEDFKTLTEKTQLKSENADFDLTLLTGYLRFGKLNIAQKALKSVAKHAKEKVAFALGNAREVIEFAKAHAEEFQGPWKDAAGVVGVIDDRARKMHWLLRYDGQVFGADDVGVLHHQAGLPLPPAPVTVAYSHLRLGAKSVAVLYPFGRRALAESPRESADIVYLLDERKGVWTSSVAYDGAIDFSPAEDSLRAQAGQWVAKNYPPLKGDPVRDVFQIFDRFTWYEGDILLYGEPRTSRLIDVSERVGQAAGLGRPAHVYKTPPAHGNRQVLFTECGFWILDKETLALTRVPLGLPDENVITVHLPIAQYGKRPDGQLPVGIAPQHGGQIFLFNPETEKVSKTDGYCGLGPDDWFSQFRAWDHESDVQARLYSRYLKLAANGK